MILKTSIRNKAYGDKVLYDGLELYIEDGEKIGLIGRNGTGKTTLFNIITGIDTDFDGDVEVNNRIKIVSSRQEHHDVEDQPVLEYILSDLPEFTDLKHILDTYPEHMGESDTKMQRYYDAIERFNTLGYFEIEDEIAQLFRLYQLNPERLTDTIGSLSGGQKRLVELVKVQRARAHLALIDEPTNHMDYVAKEAFIKWLRGAQEAVVCITHDRDVLKAVDRIIEIRDGKAFSYRGNYDDYLRIHTVKITSEVNEYTLVQRRIANLKDDVIRFRRLKERSRDPGTIKRFKGLEERAVKELEELKQKEKPSFWIDRDSAGELSQKMSEAYEEHKARNIRIRARTNASRSNRLLIEAQKVSLGYDTPLFEDISFQLREGEKIRLHGRNGAGKSTLVRALLSKAADQPFECTKYAGSLVTEKQLLIGVYEQEIDPKYLEMTLSEAIEHAFMAKNVPVSEQKVKQQLGDYLFNPQTDGDVPLSRLSGGQKARFQLMNMLAGDPQILILDEPTNHLDLPSIEELEDALKQYHGAIVYISHDSYFTHSLGGTEVVIANA
jgi:ATPase subunit of ABC transporter with duplicated ATPase domains